MPRAARIVVPGASHHSKTCSSCAMDQAHAYRALCYVYTGRPLGSDRFLSKVEHLIGRRVRPLPIGRQKGWRKNKQEGRTTQRKKQNANKDK